ncbi:MAG: HpsJ family protein [Actinomycetota bacterium]
MKATNSRQISSMTARTLKVVGVIIFLTAVLDALILSLPGESSDLASRGWQLAVTTQVVDRGIVPMIGIALLFAGFWVDSNSGIGQENRNPWIDLRNWAVVIASLLGLIYLVLVPIHLNNINQELKDSLAQIDQQATQAESQLNAQMSNPQFKTEVSQQQTQLKNQLSSILADENKFQQALASEQVPEPIKNILKESKNNPQALEKFLEQQAQAIPTQGLTQIRNRKQQLEKEARTKSRNASLQTGISSLLLAIGYTTIGWTGFRSMGLLRIGRHKG